MAYTTPPTFADGTVLSATDLNKLSTNQEYFKGLLDVPNIGHISGPDTFYIRHTHDYFHWWFKYIGSDVESASIKIYSVDGTLQYGGPIWSDTSITADDRDSYNVSALTVGDWYRIVVAIETDGGQLDVIYLEERSTA